MLPDCWTPACLAREIAGGVASDAANAAADTVLDQLAAPISAALSSIFALLISWLLIPAVDLLGQCAAWVDAGAPQCTQSPSLQLRQWMVPVTALVLLGGLIWQGVVTAVTRKGQPLLQAGKGLVAAAAWGAVGIVGTQMALRAGDQYSCWIIGQSLGADANACDPSGIANGLLVDDAVQNLSQMLALTGLSAGFLTLVFGLIVMLIVLVQLLLMVFREASIVILAGLLQLAAAGLVTRGTSGWFQKVVAWVLTLVAYKPIVATVYATTFLLLGGDVDPVPQDADDVTQLRWLVLGLAMLVLSLVALPAAAKFFNWTVGQTSGGGGGGGMLAGAAMAGMYALGSHRPAGAADQARATERALPTPGPGRSDPGSGATTPKALPPGHGGRPSGTPPGPATAGPGAAAGPGAGATTAGATGAAGAGAGAAGGPAGMAAMAVLQGAQQTAGAAKQQATSATQTGG
jgi:hypothetical protein